MFMYKLPTKFEICSPLFRQKFTEILKCRACRSMKMTDFEGLTYACIGTNSAIFLEGSSQNLVC